MDCFNKEWTVKYYFIEIGNKAVCLLCHESVAVFKEYNLKRHNQTQHANFGQNYTSEERKRRVFSPNSRPYKMLQRNPVLWFLTKRNKPFSDGEFIKECISDVANIMCPEQNTNMDSIALSRRTLVRRVGKISDDLMSQLKDTSKQFL